MFADLSLEDLVLVLGNVYVRLRRLEENHRSVRAGTQIIDLDLEFLRLDRPFIVVRGVEEEHRAENTEAPLVEAAEFDHGGGSATAIDEERDHFVVDVAVRLKLMQQA